VARGKVQLGHSVPSNGPAENGEPQIKVPIQGPIVSDANWRTL
jgi:hypothetical protein